MPQRCPGVAPAYLRALLPPTGIDLSISMLVLEKQLRCQSRQRRARSASSLTSTASPSLNGAPASQSRLALTSELKHAMRVKMIVQACSSSSDSGSKSTDTW